MSNSLTLPLRPPLWMLVTPITIHYLFIQKTFLSRVTDLHCILIHVVKEQIGVTLPSCGRMPTATLHWRLGFKHLNHSTIATLGYLWLFCWWPQSEWSVPNISHSPSCAENIIIATTATSGTTTATATAPAHANCIAMPVPLEQTYRAYYSLWFISCSDGGTGRQLRALLDPFDIKCWTLLYF